MELLEHSGKPLVSVCMITYNHANYITEAIEGVLKQVTNFKIELVIGEDLSTDNTRAICQDYAQRYPEIIKLLPTMYNIGAMQNFTRTLETCIGKYIAICDGDDYWTSPHKLQDQLNFLERNQDYGLVCSDYHIFVQEHNLFSYSYLKNSFQYSSATDINLHNYLIERKYIRTLTVLFKAALYKSYVSQIDAIIRLGKSAGDLPLWLFLLSQSKARYIPEITAVYRVTPGTASRITDIEKRFQFKKDILEIIKYYADRLNVPKSIRSNIKKHSILTQMEYDFHFKRPLKVLLGIIDLIAIGKSSKAAILLLLGSCNIAKKEYVINRLKLETYLIK
jgi:glycosyltransferase involved in cell wall biosynthesis